MRFQVCTIVTRSYLAHARVLYRSFRRFHPDARFTVLVFDADSGTLNEEFETVLLKDIGLPSGEYTRMPMLYDVTELATALKPWLFRSLLEREKIPLLYFDPDIEIFAPINELAELAAKHCLVLTPHTTSPMSREAKVKPNETDILRAGAYNLGFLGLNPDSGRFLDWWSERLLREAMIDFSGMRFTDQRWMDFAPGYFDTIIVKDETYNVAYWNADSRRLNWNGAGYELNGKPLSFFHFSGFKVDKMHLLSSHQGSIPRTRLSEQPVLAKLCREYTEKLKETDHDRLRELPYRWGQQGPISITKDMRKVYGAALLEHDEKGTPEPPSPFSDLSAFIKWLNEPLFPRRCPEITRYFSTIYENRSDLMERFPDLLGRDSSSYYEWLRDNGRHEIPIPQELFPAVDNKMISSVEPSPTDTRPTKGVTLTGYFRAELGLGQTARLMAGAVEAAGETLSTNIWSVTESRQNHPWNGQSDVFEPHYDTNLICINADRLLPFARAMGREFFRDRYNIGLWFWETETFPPAMYPAFNFLQEVWVTSQFVRDAMAKVSPIPIFVIPHPLNLKPDTAAVSRGDLGLPGGFMFLFSFDLFSVLERKNPIGLIRAFKRAFAPGEGQILVLKSINGHRRVAELEQLHYECEGRADIHIRDGYLDEAQKNALTATCDCYVSLHRSEGFGQTIAEAMLLEKPAIATRYSGNLEFMDDSNSFLCDYNLRRIGPGCSPYQADARWAEPNLDDAARLMRFVYEHPDEARRRAKKGRADVCAGHDPTVVAGLVKNRLTELRQQPPEAVPAAATVPERASVTKVRMAIQEGVNVRRTVPSLLTWFLQGPRRAMKKFLRLYEAHHRKVSLSALDAFKEIDAEWLRERSSLRMRMAAQEEEIQLLKEELRKMREEDPPER